MKYIKLNALPVYDDKYIKAKIRTYKYYLQVYLDNCTYKIVNKKMINYLDENNFED